MDMKSLIGPKNTVTLKFCKGNLNPSINVEQPDFHELKAKHDRDSAVSASHQKFDVLVQAKPSSEYSGNLS